ncbi:GntR family transcriptional regulator [Listeria ilorinensis]|uniref:GntR family transcriptional regulator n=1 Tax=Listeria ilorinensis TaxID=2867439 RepID=UPI001EF5E10E|nr:GntR family transcriptional regulator [Listeria ilorinensis]
MENKQRETMETKCYREIKKRIKNGQFPPGTRLIETAISKELNISRTPVRRAIAMLAADGYVENIDYRGAVVKNSTISKERYLEMLDIIGLFVKQAIKRIGSKKLPVDVLRISSKQTEIHWQYRDSPEIAGRKYERFLIMELLSYLKNDYYKQIAEDFFERIDQFGNQEVLAIIHTTSEDTIVQLEKVIQLLLDGNYGEAVQVVEQLNEQQILAAYR